MNPETSFQGSKIWNLWNSGTLFPFYLHVRTHARIETIWKLGSKVPTVPTRIYEPHEQTTTTIARRDRGNVPEDSKRMERRRETTSAVLRH